MGAILVSIEVDAEKQRLNKLLKMNRKKPTQTD